MLTTFPVHNHKTIISLWTLLSSKEDKENIHNFTWSFSVKEESSSQRGECRTSRAEFSSAICWWGQQSYVHVPDAFLFVWAPMKGTSVTSLLESLFRWWDVGSWVKTRQSQGKQNSQILLLQEKGSNVRTETKSDKKGPATINKVNSKKKMRVHEFSLKLTWHKISPLYLNRSQCRRIQRKNKKVPS